ncbi:TPA: valine--tRNA ligase [Candidatus Acetothermia bacterium]|nr:valine--tRNA ligase [Candidatus Acetothermia bacterium]
MEIQKKYLPQIAEEKWYSWWQEKGYFNSVPDNREPYTVVIPPPNVTGVLHMGHMLNNTLQDVLVRRARMKGFNTCWLPGTDHASIATEAKVVAKLKEEGIEKNNLTREEFLQHAWEWKEKHGGIILEQLKKLGASCDWNRTRFTMDPTLSDSVIAVFVDLYKKGLVYRGVRMVNWDPKAFPAVSDEEVIYKEVKSRFYYLRYLLEDSEDEFVTIATTRPETILGDTAICVHPDDPRYQHLKGKRALVPLINRSIPIIFDEYVDRGLGTGALKVTPAHDVNDYNLGLKHQLRSIDIFNPNGTLNEKAQIYIGEDRFVVREKISSELAEKRYLIKTEEIINNVGFSERTDEAIEPKLSLQWFLKMEPLAKPALEVVMDDTIRFHPAKFKNTYRYWMENVRDWCISRQLWWGHRIPAWYGPDGETFIGLDEAEARQLAAKHYGRDVLLRQDEDVLDTWFSAALWPFSVMGWPEKTAELKLFYPTSLLVTAFDILFFWVARMAMMGLHFMGDVPFREALITPFIVDEHGQKMSRSRGNMIDALEVKDSHGMDALRFTMTQSSSKGREMRVSMRQLDEARNFQNKLWNMARFVLTYTADLPPEVALDGRELTWEDRWILSRLSRLAEKVREELDRYNFHLASEALYHVTWHELCDWYLELAKLRLQGEDPEAKMTCQLVLREALDTVVRLLHPFMPFLTEEIWSHMGQREALARAEYPRSRAEWVDPEAEGHLNRLMELIREVRAVRAEVGVPAATEVELVLASGAGAAELATVFAPAIGRLARAASVRHEPSSRPPAGAARGVAGEIAFFLPLSGVVEWEAVRVRIQRDLAQVDEALGKLDARLSNPQFRGRAAADIVAKAEAEASALRVRRSRLERHLAR